MPYALQSAHFALLPWHPSQNPFPLRSNSYHIYSLFLKSPFEDHFPSLILLHPHLKINQSVQSHDSFHLLVITHEMIFKISRFKIIYFFIHFNSVLVYTIVMKRYVTYPDWVEKFRSPGHTIKKTKQGYGLYSCTSKYVPGGKPKSIQTYLGKITPDGFIPKSVVSKHPVYVEFGLSHFIISSFKRDLIRSSFRATDDTVYLGVVQYIFGSCQDIFLSSCFLTYKNKESLCKYRDSISATRIKTISNKIARLMESYFDAQEIAVLSQILKLAVVDVTSDHIYYPTIPEEVVDIIERNGLHYE